MLNYIYKAILIVTLFVVYYHVVYLSEQLDDLQVSVRESSDSLLTEITRYRGAD